MPITRTPLVDDDGTETTGTLFENAWLTQLYDAIDAVLTGFLSLAGGTVTGITTFTADVRTTAWTDYSGTSTITGWSSLTTQKIFYKKIGKLVFVMFQLEGTSNATSAGFTLPVARSTDAGFNVTFILTADTKDNGAAVETKAYGVLPSASSTVTTAKSAAGDAWTASGSKRIAGQFFYEAAS